MVGGKEQPVWRSADPHPRLHSLLRVGAGGQETPRCLLRCADLPLHPSTPGRGGAGVGASGRWNVHPRLHAVQHGAGCERGLERQAEAAASHLRHIAVVERLHLPPAHARRLPAVLGRQLPTVHTPLAQGAEHSRGGVAVLLLHVSGTLDAEAADGVSATQGGGHRPWV